MVKCLARGSSQILTAYINLLIYFLDFPHKVEQQQYYPSSKGYLILNFSF
ncbi:hypothetical protein [Mesomycoplasma hyopneumoniae]|nr:hypothetical protein [Mesomycoplasma hyopneumoniae]